MQEEEKDTRLYRAVINHEEQYSVWFADRDIPDGWRDAGKTGTKDECLDFIETVWTDMRPLSLREHMKAAEDRLVASSPVDQEDRPFAKAERTESLAERLSRGRHPVQFHSLSEEPSADLRTRVDRGFVLIQFTETKGGTELGVRIDVDATSFIGHGQDGKVHIEGELTLDFQRVRCIVDLDISSLKGEGHLILID